MSEIYATGFDGERLLAGWLATKGKTVEASDNKTFDMIVDGKYAEVKTSLSPYSKLGFIGLTEAQYKALRSGVEFSIFVVCNSSDPANLQIIEIAAVDLRNEEPKVVPTYYWYRSQLERCRSSSPG